MGIAAPATGAWGIISAAGRAAIRAAIPALFILAYGLLNAKDLTDIRSQATTFAIAVAVVLFTTIQAVVPQLSWRSLVAEAYAKYLDAATQAGVGTFVALVIGFLGAPDWSAWPSFVTGALVAAGAAILRALQAMLTPGEPVADPVKEPKVKPRSALASA